MSDKFPERHPNRIALHEGRFLFDKTENGVKLLVEITRLEILKRK